MGAFKETVAARCKAISNRFEENMKRGILKATQTNVWSSTGGNLMYASVIAAYDWGPLALLTLVERSRWKRSIRIGCLVMFTVQSSYKLAEYQLLRRDGVKRVYHISITDQGLERAKLGAKSK